MTDVTDTLNQAIIAVKAGRKAEARHLLQAVLDADERNEQAWLWMGNVVENDEDRIICLENVLIINPHNEMARDGLVALRAKNISPSQSAGESPPDRTRLADNRLFIAITIILSLMLICIVVSILAFVILSPSR